MSSTVVDASPSVYATNAADTSPSGFNGERIHSLDALRAFALLLGVVLHSTLAFILPGGAWAVGTTEPSGFLMWFVYYTHCFRMELFFLLAGFFAHLVVTRRGVGSFLRDRAKRILLVFVVVLLPMKVLLAICWVAGGTKTGWLKEAPVDSSDPWKVLRGVLELDHWSSMNLGHLWFLYYLVCVTGLFLLLRTVANAITKGAVTKRLTRTFGSVMKGWFAPVLLALIIAPILTRMSGTDIDTPDKGFAWHLPVLLLYGFFFAIGWFLRRDTGLLEGIGRRWKLFLPASLVVSLMAGALVGVRSAPNEPWVMQNAVALKWVSSFATSLTMTLAVFGWMGLFLRKCNAPSPRARYVAEASYYIYLVHLPIVVGLQVALAGHGLHWSVQLLLINSAAFIILFVTYHYLVRSTWLGAWLNGKWFAAEDETFFNSPARWSPPRCVRHRDWTGRPY